MAQLTMSGADSAEPSASTKEFDDNTNYIRWQELALENKNRVVVEKCEGISKYLRSMNGLVYDGLNKLRFQRVVVDVVCEVVSFQIRFEDSYIQGRSRMCKGISRHFEWLGMVHGLWRVNNVLIALNRLNKKSLLQGVGDGVKTRIGMHDLWRAFCVAVTKIGKLKRRSWVYDVGKCSELVESSSSGDCFDNVKRMVFLKCESRSLERVNFD